MSAVMKMDVAPNKHLYVLLAAALVVLIVAIIVGGAGPQVYESTYFNAYKCPGGSHTWNSTVCTGVELRMNSSFITTLPFMHPFNKVWILEAKPYKQQNFSSTGLIHDLSVSVSLWGTNDDTSEDTTWHGIRIRDVHTEKLNCKSSSRACDSITLIEEEFVDYSYYQLEITLPPSPGQEYVGDVEFKLLRYTKGYGDVEISYRTIYLFVILAALGSFILKMRTRRIWDWSYEQKAVLILIIFTIFYNDPFYGLTFMGKKGSWFFEFLNSVFETCFISFLLLFWLVLIDKMRLDKLRFEPTVVHIVQLFVVGIYAILTLSLFAWARIRAAEDPVYSERDGLTGITVLFWFIAAVYGSILIWLIVLVVMTIPVVNTKPYLMKRFVFMGVPTVLCIFSIIVGIFAGSLGPFNRNSLGFVYFLNLYNVYTLILLAGVWPADDRVNTVTTSEPTEDSEIMKYHDEL